MSNQNAIQDDNQIFGLIAHSGTAGTAETIRVVATNEGAVTIATNEVAPTDSTKNNPSFALSYSTAGELGTAVMTIGTTTYTRTLTWVGGNCTAVSVWS